MLSSSRDISSNNNWIDFSALYAKADIIFQAYDSKNLVFILGSGASRAYASDMPDWSQLLQNLLSKLHIPNINHRNEINNLINNKRYILAAEAIKHYASEKSGDIKTTIESSIEDFLQRRIRKSQKNPILHLTLFDFAVPIFTTNYDTIIEDLLNEYDVTTYRRVPITFENERDASLLLRPSNKQEAFLFKLHGSSVRGGKLIFDETDFLNFYLHRIWPSSLELLRHILTTKLVIFLGYTASAPELTFMLREATRQSSSYQHIGFFAKDDISPIEQQTLKLNYKVDPIIYPEQALLPFFVMEMRSFYRQEGIPLRFRPDISKLESALDEIRNKKTWLKKCPTIVFGSYSKYGTFSNTESDLDLLFLPNYSNNETRISIPTADNILGRRIDITIITFQEFESFVRNGDPFSTSVLLTGCSLEDPEGRYSILARGFRGNYDFQAVLQNIYERYCLRWLRLCIYLHIGNISFFQACYQWIITLMQMFLIKGDYPFDELSSISLLGNPRHVIHEFSLRFDDSNEQSYLNLFKIVKRHSINTSVIYPSIHEILKTFREVLVHKFNNEDLNVLLPGEFLINTHYSEIAKIYNKVSHLIDAMNKGQIRISLGYGSTDTELSFLSAIQVEGFHVFDYLFFTELHNLVKRKFDNTREIENDQLLDLCLQAQLQWKSSPGALFSKFEDPSILQSHISLNTETLLRIITQTEGLKIDFKRDYKLDKDNPPQGTDKQKWVRYIQGQWNEFIKDIISLANGNSGTADQSGFLIIGVDDEVSSNGTRQLYDTTHIKLTRSQIMSKVNKVCTPPIPDILCERLILDGKSIFVIEIPPSPYVHEINCQLDIVKGHFDESGQLTHITSDKAYSAHIVFIRRGEDIGLASGDERKQLELEKNLFFSKD